MAARDAPSLRDAPPIGSSRPSGGGAAKETRRPFFESPVAGDASSRRARPGTRRTACASPDPKNRRLNYSHANTSYADLAVQKKPIVKHVHDATETAAVQ